MSLIVVGLSHHSSPVTFREKFAFKDEVIPHVLQKLKDEKLVEEAVILSTCNRVELYASSPGTNVGSACSALKDFLVRHHQYDGPVGDEIYSLSEPESLVHLFKVASGLDSMVLGETEILGQLKKSYETALHGKHTGIRLNKAFQRAFNVAKQIRTETNIQRGSISVGSVAVELAETIFSELNDRHVMVIGAGDTSEKTARALLSRGAKSIIVANRSFDRAASLAEQLGGRAVHFDEWCQEFKNIDIAISSTSAPHYVLDRQRLEPMMKLRNQRPLLLIDIAVPRDIDPDVNYLENVYLYNIDDLHAIADDYLKQRKEEIARCEEIIQSKVATLFPHQGSRPPAENGGLVFGEP